MGLKINYNGAATNAWRNLSVNDSALSGSVEKLSSGLRINKGADDPAGLIISERLGAQISGLGQAIQNAQEAVSLVQTAEGALTEVNAMLNNMRTLAVHAANTGVNDADAIAADQQQVDSALDSIQKIAENTRFQQVKLLDGSRSLAYTSGSNISDVDFNGNMPNLEDGDTVSIDVTTAATQGSVTGTAFGASHAAGTITITHEGTAYTVDVADDATATTIANQIDALGVTNVSATVAGGEIQVNAGYGETLKVSADVASIIGAAGASIAGNGADVAAIVTAGDQTLTATGEGWDLTISSTSDDLAGTVITLDSGTTTGTDASFTLDDNRLAFALGQDAAATEYRYLGLDNMMTTELGEVTTLTGSSLEAIRSGGTYELNGNAANAISIIDEAIDAVSVTRANLGAFQQNALETTVNTLTINKENLEASQSRIKDVDMAQEMMNFTRSQILTQAGTAMLAQANQLPQSVLQLLG